MKCPNCDKDVSNLDPYDSYEEVIEDEDKDGLEETLLIEYYSCPHCKHMWDEETTA